MTAHGSKKKRSQEDLYGVGQQPQQQVKHGRHGGNKTQNRSKTPTTNSSPEQSSPAYISPYNCAKTLLSEEEIALLVLSNNFLTSLSLETNPCFESSSEALQSSYALEKLFLEHYEIKIPSQSFAKQPICFPDQEEFLSTQLLLEKLQLESSVKRGMGFRSFGWDGWRDEDEFDEWTECDLSLLQELLADDE